MNECSLLFEMNIEIYIQYLNIKITSNNTKHTCSTVHNGGKRVEFSLKTVDPNDICLVLEGRQTWGHYQAL